uniref:Uncharacterized protein n=1 Tax=Ditylenchus dipsaci TaxID=166011 RepID=A0A915EI90_9BILA
MESFRNWLSYTTAIVVEPLEGGTLAGSEQDRKREKPAKPSSTAEVKEPLTRVSLPAAFGAATLLGFVDLEDPLLLGTGDGLSPTETSFFYDALVSEATHASIERKTLLQHRFFHALTQLQSGTPKMDTETVGSTKRYLGLR